MGQLVPYPRLERTGREACPTLAIVVSIFFAIAPLANAQQTRISSPIDLTRTVALKGHIHPKARPQYDRGPVDPSLQITYATLSLQQSPGQQAALDRLLAEQQDPSSPNHHRWLTPEQFGDRFGLSPADTAVIASWLVTARSAMTSA